MSPLITLINSQIHTLKMVEAKISDVIMSYKPLGSYIAFKNNTFIAVDNTTGEAWTEGFDTLEKAVIYLLTTEDTDDIKNY